MAEGIDLFEAISTQRAIRSFKPDPIPDQIINRLLQAAVKAPSGGINQDWRFIVIRDPEIRRKIGDMYRAGPDFEIRPDMTSQQRRVYASAQGLEDNMEQAPVLIIACVRVHPGYSAWWGSNIYPGRPERASGSQRTGAGQRFDHPGNAICRGIQEVVGHTR